MKLLNTAVAAVAGLFCLNASANTLENADALFADREQGNEKIEEALAAYEAAYDESETDATDYYIADKISALYFYQGLIAQTKDEKKEIYQNCLDHIEDYSADSTIVYNYWKGACLASWARANGILESLKRAQELVDNIEAGKQLEGAKSFQGGGIYRLGAAVYINLPKGVPGVPSQDPAKSLADVEVALSASATDAHCAGNSYFNAHVYKAKALAASGQKDAAKAHINTVLAQESCAGLAPETKVYKAELQQLLSDL